MLTILITPIIPIVLLIISIPIVLILSIQLMVVRHPLMLKLIVRDSAPNSVKLSITDADGSIPPNIVSFINAIRRTLLSEVPSTSIDLVTIHHNSTCMPNEMLTHRLCMVPLPIMPLRRREECTCQLACQSCSVTLTLNVVSREGMDVHASQLCSDTIDTSRLKGLILRMGERQSVRLTAIARTGIAKEHAKHCIVTVVIIDGEKIEYEVLDGVGRPMDILVMALNVMKGKLERLLHALNEYEE